MQTSAARTSNGVVELQPQISSSVSAQRGRADRAWIGGIRQAEVAVRMTRQGVRPIRGEWGVIVRRQQRTSRRRHPKYSQMVDPRPVADGAENEAGISISQILRREPFRVT